jgi:hypothetical protein
VLVLEKTVTEAPPDYLERFLSLLKKVRGTVAQAGGETEILWNDLSAHYACQAYPLLHEIENLMRRLIANFMLVKVGREWVEETLPKAVEEAVKNSKRKESPNVLDTVDFIHLGEMLFAPYSKRTPQDLYDKLKDVETPEDAKALQEFVPKSNWERYLGGIVACEDLYLKSRWEKLYKLRCTVAHNAPMTGGDLDEIKKLITEVKPKLQEAISKLSNVTVPPDEAELVAESAARAVNATVGEFITCWQRLESGLARRMASKGVSVRSIPTAEDLVRLRILDMSQAELYDGVRRLRNRIVHGPTLRVPAETIQGHLAGLHELATLAEAGTYIDHLRRLSEEDRMTEVQYKIDETKHEIVDTDAFSSTVAETNAFDWGVDDYEVTSIDFDDEDETCTVRLKYMGSGDHDSDRMYHGDSIAGEAEAIIDARGTVIYENVSAEVDHGDDR